MIKLANIGLFVIFWGVVLADNEIAIIPPEIITYEGLSYTIYLDIKDGIKPTKCTTENDKNIAYSLDLQKSTKGSLITHNVQPSDIADLYSLGNGICGFQLFNESLEGNKYWNLNITDANGKNYGAQSIVKVIYQKVVNYFGPKEVFIAPGESISFTCTADDTTTKLFKINFCEIYDPRGNLRFKEYLNNVKYFCTYQRDISTLEDFGEWKCLLSTNKILKPIQRIIKVTKIERDIINMWQNQTDTTVNIGCQISNPTKSTESCVLVRPDGTKLIASPGLGDEKYTTLGTNITESICHLQIKKPLQASEYGLWKCQLQTSSPGATDDIGGFISIKKDGKDIIPEPVIPKDIFVHVNKSLNIECHVPYSSPYCYTRSPSGVFYPVDDNRDVSLGTCNFIKPTPVELSDNGTWLCGFAKPDGEQDEIFSVNVHVHEISSIRAFKPEVSVKLNHDGFLKCVTQGLGDYPLQYCRFLSPDGKMFFLKDNDNSSSRIQYDGRGIQYGDCGIKINKVTKADKGIWSCITRIGTQFEQNEIYRNILLDVTDDDDLSTASVAGIAVGAVVVGAVFGFIGFKKYQSYRRNRQEPMRFSRNDETRGSNENIIPVVSANDNSYNTVN